MKRRQLILGSARIAIASSLRSAFPIVLASLAFDASAETVAPAPRAIPSTDQMAWQDLEIGMFVHFAPNTWQDAEYDNLSTPLSQINPDKLDTDQWAQTAIDLGAKYIVMVAKHVGGFCMWQTNTSDYGVRNTPWRGGHGDVMADVSDSCRKHGLKLGVYVSPRDDHFGAATGGICKTPELQTRYNRIYRDQLTEIFTRYGDLVEVWFDGSTATAVGDLLSKYQPHAMVFQGPSASIRWVGNEDGFAPDPCWNGIDRADAETGTATSLNSNPDGDVWMPNEVDVSIRRPDWFWSTTNAGKVLKPEQLLSIYYGSVGRGCQLLLNIPANRDGLLSDPDRATAKAFGSQIRSRFAKPIGETKGQGTALTLKFGAAQMIDTVILQEDTSKGERVRQYRIEALVGGAWRTLVQGSSIGHKRILPIEPVTVDAVRIVATKSARTPFFRSVAVFHTGAAAPAGLTSAPEIWAANLVGSWHDHEFSVDLTKKIDAAKQYRLRFVPREGIVTGLSNVSLKLHDVAHPNLIKPVRGKTDELIIDITGMGESIRLEGRVEGASSGDILLQKL
jgi:alpha-L-fucosidase